MVKLHGLFLFPLIWALLASCVSSENEIGGNITEDTTLSLSESPYRVNESIVIAHNITLTVESGVELQFDPGIGMTVIGSLITNGTETEKVIFTGSSKENNSVPIGFFEIRLTDGPSPHEGRLEVFLNGQWGTVCDDYWGPPDTQVACRQLGYENGYAVYNYRYGSGPIWLDHVGCSGDEVVLWNCYHRGIGVHGCGHHEDIGLVCQNPHVNYPLNSSWANVQWIQQVNATSSLESFLRHTVVENAGLHIVHDNGMLRYSILPALNAIGIPPFLDNVDVISNFADGVHFSDVSTGISVLDCHIANNAGSGIRVSTVGIGKIHVGGSKIMGNGGYGIYYDGYTYPEDDVRYKFCGYNMSLDDHIYLDHATNDFIDPYECLQEFSSPPNTTLTAYLTYGSGHSSYTGLEFWDGNTTDDLLASIQIHETNGELITTTTNTMTVRIFRQYMYSTYFTLLITVQKGLDYDLSLESVDIFDNGGGLMVKQMRRRLIIEHSTFTHNFGHGINVDQSYGHLLLYNSDVSHNKGVGLRLPSSYGKVYVDSSDFHNNTENGIYVRFATLQSLHTYTFSVTSTRLHGNGDVADVAPLSCNYFRWYMELVSNTLSNQVHGGLKLSGSCNSYSYARNGHALISGNEFTDIQDIALNILWVSHMTIVNNTFSNNTRDRAMLINLPSSYLKEIMVIRRNTFVDNSADEIVYFNGQRSSGIDGVVFEDNVFVNNTCFVVLKIQFNPNGYIANTDVFNITGNYFISNIPYPFLNHVVHFLPIAVISFDKPQVVVRANFMENPLFPLQLIISGDNFGMKVKADLNWWGTDNEAQIQECIWDHLDRYEFATIDYFPFLLSADPTDVVYSNASRYVMPFERDGTIGGVVYGNIVLSNTSFTYYVDRDITIAQSSVLRIDAGVSLSFSHFSGVFVHGTLIAVGNLSDEVLFTSMHVITDEESGNNLTTIRLEEGSAVWEGRLELFVEGEWHSFCSNYWTQENALVACRELGYFDVINSNFYPRKPGSGPIMNYPVKCKGNEMALLDCDPYEDPSAQCTSHTYDINIQCRRPVWSGMIFPANNEVSVLRHVQIENAGFIYLYDSNTIQGTQAINVHLHHHEFSNVDIISSNKGMKVLYPDPLDNLRPLISFTITNCNGHGSEFFSNGFLLENWNVFNCQYPIFFTKTTNVHTDLIRYVESSNSIFSCRTNETIGTEDIIMLSPPVSGSRSCDGIFTITNIDPDGRLGVFVLYSSSYARITVEEENQVLLSAYGSTPHDNSAVSNGSTIVIRHQSSYYYSDYTFYILVKAVHGSTKVPTRQHLDSFVAKHINITDSRRTSSNYGIYFTPDQWTELVIRDITIDLVYGSTSIYITRTMERLDLSNGYFANTQYGLRFYVPSSVVISNSSFYNMNYGISSQASGYATLNNNKTTTVENIIFHSISSRALYIYELYELSRVFNSHWIIQNCIFNDTTIGVWINSRSSIGTDMMVPRFTIEKCIFAEESQYAIRTSASTWDLSIVNSIFQNNNGIVLDIGRVGELSSLMVINNTFEDNSKTVLRIPNELQQCNVQNNSFFNNLAPYIVEYFEAVPLSSAMTSGFNHIFSGNYLIGNRPQYSSDNQGLACVIITKVFAGIFQFNTFRNEDFLFEFCLGKITYFDEYLTIDATFNDWNTTDESEIASKIFDINDWNDRPGVSFRPYLNPVEKQGSREETDQNVLDRPPLGGRLSRDRHLGLVDSPYFVQSDLTISANVTLTIEQGVEMMFAPNVGLLVLGRLVARGSESSRIVMKGLDRINYTIPVSGAVRLRDGPYPYQGRLEIFFNGEWGTVCDDGWGWTDADVACRQLGLGPPLSYLNRDYTGTPPDRIWLDGVGCSGDETTLADCPSRGIGVIYSCNHYEDVGLECEHQIIDALGSNYWGGIRMIGGEASDLSESVLEYVDIINTGYLHFEHTPGLYIRHGSPKINHVNIRNMITAYSDGFLFDTPTSKVNIQNTAVKNTINGMVVVNAGNIDLDFNNITITETKMVSLDMRQENGGILLPMCYLKTIQVCLTGSDDVITVERHANLLIQTSPKVDYITSSSPCNVFIQPSENQTLVLEIYRVRYYYYDYVNVYEAETNRLLGQLRYNEKQLIVVSPTPGATLRFYCYTRTSYATEIYLRVIATESREIKQVIRGSTFADNSNGVIVYSSFPSRLKYGYTPHWPSVCLVHFERCEIILNKASVTGHAIEINLHRGSEFQLENCQISDNYMLGGVSLYLEDGLNNAYGNGTRIHRIINNEFTNNTQGNGVIYVRSRANPADMLKIFGNRILHNSPVYTVSVVDTDGTYIDFNTNTAYNNSGKRLLFFNQQNLSPKFQECKNNLFSYNIGEDINQKFTLQVSNSGIQIYSNVIQNPANDYEISAMSTGTGFINATLNWWGTVSSERIKNGLRDSGIVIGFPDIIYDPFLHSSPSNVQTYYCPVGYFIDGFECYGYKGGAVQFSEAVRSCSRDGAILPTRPSSKLQNILRNRNQLSDLENGIWLYMYYLPGNNVYENEASSLSRCFILEPSESSAGTGVRETSCYNKQPYICIRSARVKCPNACFGNGLCHGATCVCNTGWEGKDCSQYHCRDMNQCSGFGTCVGPNQCKCRGGWQKLQCNYRQCNKTAPDTDAESCQRCLDIQQCFTNKTGNCQTWDEVKCPSGIVSKSFNDTSRIMDVEIEEDVRILDAENVTIYRCPVVGSDDFANHMLFITSQIVDITEGQILSSEQANGVLHRIGTVTNKDHHTFLMGRQADFAEVIKYADFSQPLEIEPAGDPAITDDTPSTELIDELLYGNFTMNETVIVQLSEDVTTFKCLGNLYINEENPEEQSLSSFIFLPNDDDNNGFSLGDILIVNGTTYNVESVKDIVSEQDAIFVHTELTDCSDNTTYMDGIKERLSHHNLFGDEIDLSCRGGSGRNYLLVLNSNIDEGSLVIAVNDTIVGSPGDRFVGMIVSKTTTAEHVILEVLTARTLSEMQALPHFSLLSARRRVKRGTFTLSPHYSVSLAYSKLCSGKAKVVFNPTMKLTFETSGFFDIEKLGMELSGKVTVGMDVNCDFGFQKSYSVTIPLGNKFLGTFKFFIGYIPIVISFHATAQMVISGMAQARLTVGASTTASCEAKGSALWREGSEMIFPKSKAHCNTDITPIFRMNEPDNTNVGPKASVSALLTAGLKGVYPAKVSLPKCSKNPGLREWIKRATKIAASVICSKPPEVSGLSLTLSVTAKAEVGAEMFAHTCPDPRKSTSISVIAGLDNFALAGSFKIANFSLQASTSIPAGFEGYQKQTCVAGFPCCLCEEEGTGELVPGKLHPKSGECLCPCFCDPPHNTVESVKETGGQCECDLCPDDRTLKRFYLRPYCYCNCADGTEREMKSDGSCPCECNCDDGSKDLIDGNGECPCLCDCKDCTKSTLGPTGCRCKNTCPPCEAHETQVWENCECQCRGHDECGIAPTCVLGRIGEQCDRMDCFPCLGCSGNGVCTSMSGRCSSSCRCNRGWGGSCCEIQLPRRFWGDPHLETIDGNPYDFYGIGEFVFCQSRENDFGVQSRFFYYNTASLVGAVAVKAGENVVTITTPGITNIDLPNLRIDGALAEVEDKLKYTLGNSTVILDIQRPVSNDSADGVAIAILSFQFKSGTSFTIEVRHSEVMERQFMNLMFAPSVTFREKTEGLCGFMDEDDTNDFQGPDQVTYVDPIEFAESWRLSTSQLNPGIHGSWSWNESNFHINDTMDISYTDSSYVPIYSIEDIPEEQKQVAIEICSALEIEDSLLDGCIYDIAVTNDTSFSEQESLKTGCPSQCSGKGRCINSTCECLEGWSGEECHIGSCGECIRGSCDAGFCRCDIGWEGPTCDIEATCYGVNNCTDLLHGQCLRTDTCLCTAGYTGNNCSLTATCYNELNCSSHGVCIDFDVCDCDNGWKGSACDSPSCETFGFCSGNGNCISYEHCDCFFGWNGPSCGIPDCTDLGVCSGNGDCIAPNTCECYSGYAGSNCSLPLNCSHLNDCSDQGLCVVDDADQLSCRCYLGFSGLECSDMACDEVNECYGHGICEEPNLCDCDLGYTGIDCSLYSCEILGYCSGHGSCTEYDVCNCTEGYQGITCDISSCNDVNNCTEQGVCIDLNVCICNDGFEGIQCDIVTLPNEVAPIFLQSEYNVTIPENTPPASIIFTVEANDTDVGRNGDVIYSFAFGTEFFAINGGTGEISTRMDFDYESRVLPNVFNLVAMAEDDGRPMLSSTASVAIYISDVNDNCPEIIDGELINTIEVPPDAPIGTIIHQISADDADLGLNGQIVYSFYQVSETIPDLFNVSSNGTIYTVAHVPVNTYALRVLVSDLGDPPCAVVVQVSVLINVPITEPPSITTMTTTTFSHTTVSPQSSEGISTKSKLTVSTGVLPTGSEGSSTHSKLTMAKSTVVLPTESEDCKEDAECGSNGVCSSGKCECTSCLYTGKKCEIEAQCYQCSMIVDALNGTQVDFDESLEDSESDEFKNTVQVLLPFIDLVMLDTNEAAEAFLRAEISSFSSGSIVVHYTVTLDEGASLSDKQLEKEMNEALVLHRNDPSVTVREGSISVSEHRVPVPEDTLNMVIFTYVGCSVGMLGALLVIATYLPNRKLLQQRAVHILLNFCTSLLGQYASYITLIVLVSEDVTTAQLCNVLAGLLHYFVLATAAWTVVESISACGALFDKFAAYTPSFLVLVSVFAFAWGTPAIIVVISSQVTQEEYAHDEICSLQRVPIIASAIVLLSVVVVFAIAVCVSVWTITKKRPTWIVAFNLAEDNSQKELATRLKKDVIVLVLLSITWVVGYLALIPTTSYIAQPFLWLVSTLLGIALFVLFVYQKPVNKIGVSHEEDDTGTFPATNPDEMPQMFMVPHNSSQTRLNKLGAKNRSISESDATGSEEAPTFLTVQLDYLQNNSNEADPQSQQITESET